MGITERKGRQRAELRARILDASRTIISRDGFDALTMRKIADAIEYSPATIYLHFQNRDEIAAQLVRDGFAALLAALLPAVAEPDPLLRIRSFGRRYLGFARDEPETYKLIFMEDERFGELIAAVSAETRDDDAFALLLATVRELIATGRFRALDPHTIAALLWAGLHGIAALALSCPGFAFPDGIEEPGEHMIEALIRGFAADGPR